MNELCCGLTFLPNLHPKIWGGEAIGDFKGIDLDRTDIGESWEVSAMPGAESVVEQGPYAGLTLSELTERFGASLLGDRVFARYGARFPMLVKIIDANDDLSIQVHPDDRLAMSRHGSNGKNEVWYVVATRPGAGIRLGLVRELSPSDLERVAADGSVGEYVASYESHPGDSFFIPAGRVHSIGAGNLLVEIQQTSDITYRIFDYNRRDASGNLRQLHTDLAKDAIDYTVQPDYRNTMRAISAGCDEIVACDYFRLDRMTLDGELTLPADRSTFRVLMCISGSATLHTPEWTADIRRGQTILLPASLPDIHLAGHATLLSAQA